MFACIFSPCRRYRYAWTCPAWSGSGYMQAIGLNPSTADEVGTDPTIRRCIQFAKDSGCGSLVMTNLFAWRATDPAGMKRAAEPIGPENDNWLRLFSAGAKIVLAAWGTHGNHLQRGGAVRELIPRLHVLRLTAQGHPQHPLYLPAALRPTLWSTLQ